MERITRYLRTLKEDSCRCEDGSATVAAQFVLPGEAKPPTACKSIIAENRATEQAAAYPAQFLDSRFGREARLTQKPGPPSAVSSSLSMKAKALERLTDISNQFATA